MTKKGSADWTADYLFSKTGRQVFNEIHAEFEFKDGKIFRHHDTFDIWKWSRQALGISGSSARLVVFSAKQNPSKRAGIAARIQPKSSPNKICLKLLKKWTGCIATSGIFTI